MFSSSSNNLESLKKSKLTRIYTYKKHNKINTRTNRGNKKKEAKSLAKINLKITNMQSRLVRN
jgi:hypothetical protein